MKRKPSAPTNVQPAKIAPDQHTATAATDHTYCCTSDACHATKEKLRGEIQDLERQLSTLALQQRPQIMYISQIKDNEEKV